MTSDEDVWSLGMAWKEVLDDGVSLDRVPPAWDFDLEFDFDLRCDREGFEVKWELWKCLKSAKGCDEKA